ncbi:hypothetical protein [Catellatospora citrea]|uniref:DUF2207 domain-containing protein n=1 Tax=Catellatospora citrea TaxID=53366 RepID=A0A8J3K872_9ACTN|nr:hypothetical protein [Catellatospora citrea]RKE12835.1 hypothetical protein C8E86_7780 [Catellatospora citrea]GIF95924.1 hypothetical protein Cci01nite_10180 [Catellatospora citrea]
MVNSLTDLAAERPALAALLVQPPSRVAAAGAYATMLDLVARGVLAVDAAAGTVQAPQPDPAGLAPFEKHVFDAVVAREPGRSGPIPLGAIDLGSPEQSRQWHQRFTDLLGETAIARGLVRPRAPLGVRVVLWIVFTVLWVGAVAVAWQAGRPQLGIGVVLAACLVSLPLRWLKRLVPHGRGTQLAAGYARLRAEPGMGPGDPRLAYAVAVGAGPPSLGTSPFAYGKQAFAWSRRDGTWRRVAVVDGRGFSFGWSPWAALGSLIPAALFFGIWLVLLRMFSADLDVGQVADLWLVLLLGAGWVLWVLAVVGLARIGWRGLHDAVHPARVVAGPVIWLESDIDEENTTYRVAVDDGADVAVRYQIAATLYHQLRKDQWLRLEVTPKLGHVRRAEIVDR